MSRNNRAKKPKKPAKHRPAKTPYEIVKQTNYVAAAAAIRTLYQCHGWSYEQLGEFFAGYLALLEELNDHRNGVRGFVNDCKALTGIDVVTLLDSI